MCGNLLAAVVLYLLLVAGRAIPASVPLIVLSLAVLGLIGAWTLWMVGAFGDNYQQSVAGKKGFLLASGIIAGTALLVLLYLAAAAGAR